MKQRAGLAHIILVDSMKKTIPLAELYDIFVSNMTEGMYLMLGTLLGVSPDAVKKLGVGFFPAEQAWIFPERDAKGNVTGLMRRYFNGKKFCMTGTKHGLYFAYNVDSDTTAKRYSAGKHNWTRVDSPLYPCKDVGCPVCGRKKYCMVSAEDPANPAAVLCTKEKKGSKGFNEKSASYLHILDEARNLCGSYAPVVKFTDEEGPILIVEGSSDVLAAFTLGFDVIGKFSNLGGLDILRQMPIGDREVWIIGENDQKQNGDWPGKDGVERTFLSLRGKSKCIRVMPPDGVKDLRTWLDAGLTREQLIAYVKECGDSSTCLGPDMFEDDIAANIAKRFIDDQYMVDNAITLKMYHGGWCTWNGYCYKEMQLETLKGQLYEFLDGKHFVQTDGKGGDKVVPYKVTRSKISDILDAFTRWCPVYQDPPVWTKVVKGMPDPTRLITFKNGLLDLDEYMDGNIVLHNPNPNLFSLTCCPYSFDEDKRSEYTEQFLYETYNGDIGSINLFGEWAGYLMTPDLSYEKFMMLYGDPRSGKGTVLDILHHTVGADQTCATSLRAIVGRFGLQPLVGKSHCVFGDIRNPIRVVLSEALEIILGVVGADSMPVDIKRINALPSVQLKTRFSMAMNELPAFFDHSRAVESRMLVLYHPNSHVGDADPRIKQRVIKEVKEGNMINFALEGFKRLNENKEFSVPESNEMVMAQFRSISAPVSTFIEECVVLCDGETVEKNTMFSVWSAWCKRTGRKPQLPEQFGKWLMGHSPKIKSKRFRMKETGNQKVSDSDRVWKYTNVKLSSYANDNLLE